ncbi:MAG TPA: hypothetical protein VG708_13615 [Mycobacteriales bacterium]|nr:hypothetical protein [Mycobacteriales bacterium]
MSVSYLPGRHARLVVAGDLDSTAGRAIQDAIELVEHDCPRRVELDLRGVTGFTRSGAAAISDWLTIGRRLEEGVGIQVATEAGRRALLESMDRV